MSGIPRLLILLALVQAGSLKAQPGATSPIRLEIGKSVERQLTGDQTHSYEVHLLEGQYARISVEQRGIDVILRMDAGSNGKIEFDSEIRLNGEETVELVAKTAGAHRLDVQPKYKKLGPGRYTIRLAELRQANEKDRVLQLARELASESLRLQKAGKYPEARRLAEQVLEIRERELSEQHRETALAVYNFAFLCYEQEDYDCSQRLGERALRIRESVSGSEHPDVALSLRSLGNTFGRREDYGKATVLFQRALEIYQKALPANHLAIAGALNDLGIIYNRRGDLVKAEEAYRRALAMHEQVLGPEDLEVARQVNNLGTLYYAREEYARAEPMYRRALTMLEKGLGPEHPELSYPLGNLANVYSRLGRYPEAEALYERALKLVESKLGENHRSTGHVLQNFATCLRRRGDHARAEVLYQRALRIQEAVMGPENPTVARLLNAMAMNYESKGDLLMALAAEQRAAGITERELALNLAIGSERQKLAYLSVLPERTDEILSMSLGSATHVPNARELGATIVLQRKGRVQDAMAGNLSALRQRFDPEGQDLLDQWKEIITRLAGLVLGGPRGGGPAEHQKRIKDLEDRREAIEEKLSRYHAGFYGQSHQVDVGSIQPAVPPDAALIEFAVYRRMNPAARIHAEEFGPPRYAAFVVRRGRAVHARDLGNAAEVEAGVARFREALRDPKRRDVYKLARAVDERVMQPLKEALDGVSQLLISPDGVLNLIPFAALRNREGRYLAQDYRVSYLTSGRDLLRFGAPGQRAAGRPLIIADPSFDLAGPRKFARAGTEASRPRRSVTTGPDLSAVYFAPLAGASREARAIAALFPHSIILTGSEATKAALRSYPAPQILHVATHGFFLDDYSSKPRAAGADGRSPETGAGIQNPLLRSGLALAGANTASDDGILTALETSGLNLSRTKLVTLSACDTGLGEVKNGEGVYGLRRALVLAGAETLVMSLWPVSDQVTRELMTAYYTGLAQGQGRGEALRQVQLKMMKSADRRHPFYWASFIQSGDWANLDGQR
jgi:CHAT domain-containing protein/Tfp pilus assembly protein PilF